MAEPARQDIPTQEPKPAPIEAPGPTLEASERALFDTGRKELNGRKESLDAEVDRALSSFSESNESWWQKTKAAFGRVRDWMRNEKAIRELDDRVAAIRAEYVTKSNEAVAEPGPNPKDVPLPRTERELSAEYDRLAAIVAEEGSNEGNLQKYALRNTLDLAPVPGSAGERLNRVYAELNRLRAGGAPRPEEPVAEAAADAPKTEAPSAAPKAPAEEEPIPLTVRKKDGAAEAPAAEPSTPSSAPAAPESPEADAERAPQGLVTFAEELKDFNFQHAKTALITNLRDNPEAGNAMLAEAKFKLDAVSTPERFRTTLKEMYRATDEDLEAAGQEKLDSLWNTVFSRYVRLVKAGEDEIAKIRKEQEEKKAAEKAAAEPKSEEAPAAEPNPEPKAPEAAPAEEGKAEPKTQEQQRSPLERQGDALLASLNDQLKGYDAERTRQRIRGDAQKDPEGARRLLETTRWSILQMSDEASYRKLLAKTHRVPEEAVATIASADLEPVRARRAEQLREMIAAMEEALQENERVEAPQDAQGPASKPEAPAEEVEDLIEVDGVYMTATEAKEALARKRLLPAAGETAQEAVVEPEAPAPESAPEVPAPEAEAPAPQPEAAPEAKPAATPEAPAPKTEKAPDKLTIAVNKAAELLSKSLARNEGESPAKAAQRWEAMSTDEFVENIQAIPKALNPSDAKKLRKDPALAAEMKAVFIERLKEGKR